MEVKFMKKFITLFLALAMVFAMSIVPVFASYESIISYEVKTNDTLGSIANMFGVSLNDILVANEDIKDPNKIEVGQLVIIPIKSDFTTITNTKKSTDNGKKNVSSYSTSFSDCPYKAGSKEATAINYVVSRGIMKGTSATEFSPNLALNRAQLVAILWRMAGSPKATMTYFSDIYAEDWFATAACWASQKKIINGVEKNKFAPYDTVTMSQFLTILWRYYGSPSVIPGQSDNIPEVVYDYPAWALKPAMWAYNKGIFSNTDTPNNAVTRLITAEILCELSAIK